MFSALAIHCFSPRNPINSFNGELLLTVSISHKYFHMHFMIWNLSTLLLFLPLCPPLYYLHVIPAGTFKKAFYNNCHLTYHVWLLIHCSQHWREVQSIPVQKHKTVLPFVCDQSSSSKFDMLQIKAQKWCHSLKVYSNLYYLGAHLSRKIKISHCNYVK